MALRTPRAALGLDIGPGGGAVVELIDRGRRVELATYAIFSLPDDISIDEVASRVGEALERAQVSAERAAFSVPSQFIFSAAAALPNMPADQRARAINFKAKQIIPATPAEVKLSSVEHRRPDGSLDVYLTAIPKQLIAWYWQLAEKLHLEIERIEPEVFSLIRAHHVEAAATALLCSAGSQLAFHLVAGATPIASRTLDIGTEELGSEATVSDAARQVRHLVGSRRLDEVLVAGASAREPHLAQAITRITGHKPNVINPWQQVAYPAGLEPVVAELGPRLACAIGLARCRIPHKI
jgi:Tfp pilus assembly PilM family ATPase